jgi:hypothetical protein
MYEKSTAAQAFMTRSILNWHSENSVLRRPFFSRSAHKLGYLLLAHSWKSSCSDGLGMALYAIPNLNCCKKEILVSHISGYNFQLKGGEEAK